MENLRLKESCSARFDKPYIVGEAFIGALYTRNFDKFEELSTVAFNTYVMYFFEGRSLREKRDRLKSYLENNENFQEHIKQVFGYFIITKLRKGDFSNTDFDDEDSVQALISSQVEEVASFDRAQMELFSKQAFNRSREAYRKLLSQMPGYKSVVDDGLIPRPVDFHEFSVDSMERPYGIQFLSSEIRSEIYAKVGAFGTDSVLETAAYMTGIEDYEKLEAFNTFLTIRRLRNYIQALIRINNEVLGNKNASKVMQTRIAEIDNVKVDEGFEKQLIAKKPFSAQTRSVMLLNMYLHAANPATDGESGMQCPEIGFVMQELKRMNSLYEKKHAPQMKKMKKSKIKSTLSEIINIIGLNDFAKDMLREVYRLADKNEDLVEGEVAKDKERKLRKIRCQFSARRRIEGKNEYYADRHWNIVEIELDESQKDKKIVRIEVSDVNGVRQANYRMIKDGDLLLIDDSNTDESLEKIKAYLRMSMNCKSFSVEGEEGSNWSKVFKTDPTEEEKELFIDYVAKGFAQIGYASMLDGYYKNEMEEIAYLSRQGITLDTVEDLEVAEEIPETQKRFTTLNVVPEYEVSHGNRNDLLRFIYSKLLTFRIPDSYVRQRRTKGDIEDILKEKKGSSFSNLGFDYSFLDVTDAHVRRVIVEYLLRDLYSKDKKNNKRLRVKTDSASILEGIEKEKQALQKLDIESVEYELICARIKDLIDELEPLKRAYRPSLKNQINKMVQIFLGFPTDILNKFLNSLEGAEYKIKLQEIILSVTKYFGKGAQLDLRDIAKLDKLQPVGFREEKSKHRSNICHGLEDLEIIYTYAAICGIELDLYALAPFYDFANDESIGVTFDQVANKRKPKMPVEKYTLFDENIRRLWIKQYDYLIHFISLISGNKERLNEIYSNSDDVQKFLKNMSRSALRAYIDYLDSSNILWEEGPIKDFWMNKFVNSYKNEEKDKDALSNLGVQVALHIVGFGKFIANKDIDDFSDEKIEGIKKILDENPEMDQALRREIENYKIDYSLKRKVPSFSY